MGVVRFGLVILPSAMRAVQRAPHRAAPAMVLINSASRPLRPAFPTATRFRSHQASLPLVRFSSTQSVPLAETAVAPAEAQAPTAPVAKVSAKRVRPAHVISPSPQEVVERFGEAPPTSGQVVRPSKTHVKVESPSGETLWEMPWTAVHTISLTVDGAAKQKYWTLHEKQTMEARKVSLSLPTTAPLLVHLRRRPGWLRENEVRGMTTSLDEAMKQGGQITYLCYTDLKSHFLRKYGPPAPSEPRAPKRETKLSRKPAAKAKSDESPTLPYASTTPASTASPSAPPLISSPAPPDATPAPAVALSSSDVHTTSNKNK